MTTNRKRIQVPQPAATTPTNRHLKVPSMNFPQPVVGTYPRSDPFSLLIGVVCRSRQSLYGKEIVRHVSYGEKKLLLKLLAKRLTD